MKLSNILTELLEHGCEIQYSNEWYTTTNSLRFTDESKNTFSWNGDPNDSWLNLKFLKSGTDFNFFSYFQIKWECDRDFETLVQYGDTDRVYKIEKYKFEDFILPDDTILTKEWIDKMLQLAKEDYEIK